METESGRIVLGAYQSPILLQHQNSDKDVRCLKTTLRRCAWLSFPGIENP